jgi:Tfp pilus assembly protein FimT
VTPTRSDKGRSLIEVLMMMVVMAILAGLAIPHSWRFVQEYRLRGASLYMRGLIRQVRALAASKNTYVGIVFDQVDGGPELAIHIDGNANGIRRSDIRSGIDKRIRRPMRLGDLFPGVRYGSPPRGASPQFPPLRIGRSKIVSFSPIGQSTSGTLFLSNEQGSIHAVVVLGATGRVRVARYINGRWEPVS